jgi:polyisoprenoid-binding protein YceI
MTSTRLLHHLAPVALLALFAASAHAQTLQPTGSEIAFVTRQLGAPVEGRFGRFSAQIALDPKAPERGNVRLAIDTASTRFGSAELDGEVVKPGWLASTTFPQAVFQSSTIKAVAADRFEVSGKLTIKGSERPLTVPVTLARQGAPGNAVASGSFTLKRLDFRIGEAEWSDTSLLANEVQVRFKLALSGLPPP